MLPVKKLVCAKCLNVVKKENLIKCNVCRSVYHTVCANINNENDYNAVKNNKNLLFNCDNCISTSNDLIRTISFLTNEVKDLKIMIIDLAKKVNSDNENLSIKNQKNCVDTQNKNQSIISINTSQVIDQQSQPNSTIKSRTTLTHREKDLNAKAIAEIKPGSSLQLNRSEKEMSNHNDVCYADNSTTSKFNACNNGRVNDSNVNPNNEENLGSTLCYANALINSSCNVMPNPPDKVVEVGALDIASTSTAAVKSQNSDFVNVTKKKKRNNKRNVVVGQSDNNELNVIARMRWVHLSSFKPTVTEDEIISYVTKHVNVDSQMLSCYKLVKKDVNVNDLKRINFKLGIASAYYDELFKPTLWTSEVRIRPFVNFQRPQTARQLT